MRVVDDRTTMFSEGGEMRNQRSDLKARLKDCGLETEHLQQGHTRLKEGGRLIVCYRLVLSRPHSNQEFGIQACLSAKGDLTHGQEQDQDHAAHSRACSMRASRGVAHFITDH